MGYELPAGIGVRMAAGGTGSPGEVFVYIGDGTFLLNPMELITALQEQFKVTVVVIDNHGFQVIRRAADVAHRARVRQRVPRPRR